MANEIKRGMYVCTANIKDTGQWEAVIEASYTSREATLEDTPSVGIQEDVELLVGSPETVEMDSGISITVSKTYTLKLKGVEVVLSKQELEELHSLVLFELMEEEDE